VKWRLWPVIGRWAPAVGVDYALYLVCPSSSREQRSGNRWRTRHAHRAPRVHPGKVVACGPTAGGGRGHLGILASQVPGADMGILLTFMFL